MSKKENVFQQEIKALQRIGDELETTNSYLYGIGGELADLNDTLKSVKELLTNLMQTGVKVTVDFKTFTENLSKQAPKQDMSLLPKTPFPPE